MYAFTYTLTTDQEKLETFLAERTEQSFCLLCDSVAPRLLRYFRARSCDEVTAEELTQDVLFTLYRKAESIRDPRLFSSWLFRVAHNALLQGLRSRRRRIQTVGESEWPAWELAAAEAVEEETSLDVALGSLPPADREILLLRFADGLAYQEIAALLQIPVGTAKWRVFNGKLKLAAELRNGVGK